MSPALAVARLFASTFGVVGFGLGVLVARENPQENETVALDSFPSNKKEHFFDKIDALDDRPWRYAKSGNIEILSRCSDEITQRFANEIHRQFQLMKPVQPIRSLAASDAPLRLFLFKQDGWWEMKSDPTVIPVRCDWTGSSGVFLINAAAYERQPAAASEDALRRATGTVVRLFFDLQLRQRTKDVYWLRFGLSHFYLDLRFASDSVSFAWPPSLGDPTLQKKIAETAPRGEIKLLPLGEFFDGLPYQNDRPTWDLEAGLFIRWALLAEHQKRQAAFWRFAERACSEPVTETLFKEHFSASYSEVFAQLSSYLQEGRPAAEFPPLRRAGSSSGSSLRLRNANREEVERFRISVDETIAHQPRL